MKLFTFIIVIFVTMVPAIQSCNNYSDVPVSVLNLRAELLVNNWKIEQYKINGKDFTSLIPKYTESFTKNGNYNYAWSVSNGFGIWKFMNNDSEVILSGTDKQASRTLYILKLEEKSLWYYYIDGNDKHEFHLIEQ